jgi:hypothetical protein
VRSPKPIAVPLTAVWKTQVARELLDRFTNDVEVQQDGIRPDIVFENLILRAALGVPDNLVAALLDVFEEQ